MDYDPKNHKKNHMKIVGDKINRLIAITPGCTQEDVALSAGYTSNSMINQAIKGLKMIPSHRLNKIAEFFGLPEGYLSNDVEYSESDLKLLVATHDMIKNKEGHPHYRAILKLLNIEID